MKAYLLKEGKKWKRKKINIQSWKYKQGLQVHCIMLPPSPTLCTYYQ